MSGEFAHRVGLDGALGDLRKLVHGDFAAGFTENAFVMAQNVRLTRVCVDRRTDRETAVFPRQVFHPVDSTLDRMRPFDDAIGGWPKSPDEKTVSLEKVMAIRKADQG